MREKHKAGVLVVLVVVLGLTAWRWWPTQSSAPVAASGVGQARRSVARAPLDIPDARLQVERLQAASQRKTPPAGRNIFEYGRVSRPVRTVKPAVAPTPQAPRPQSPPPPPPPPLRFYGMAENQQGGARRVFLTDGDEIYVARQGDVIEGRYRVVRISGDSMELEDLVSHHRWVLWLELPQR